MKAFKIIKNDFKSIAPELLYILGIPVGILAFIFWMFFCANFVHSRLNNRPTEVVLYLIMVASPFILLLICLYFYSVYRRSR